MCTVLLPPGGNLIAVNKYIILYHISNHIIPYRIIQYHIIPCIISYIISYTISYHIIYLVKTKANILGKQMPLLHLIKIMCIYLFDEPNCTITYMWF